MDTRDVVIAAYENRRQTLLAEAREYDRLQRPLGAARRREAARLLLMAEVDEEMDIRPDFWTERESA
jgi:hypothetical protein